MMKMNLEQLKEHFRARTMPVTESGCWVWERRLRGNGYGGYRVPGRGRKMYAAHRVAYELFTGPIPKNKQVLHKCDIKCCVNPNHLYIGTQSDNIRDMYSKGRGVDNSGSKHGMSKLTERQVKNIKKLLTASPRSRWIIAKQYKVSRQCINDIAWGRRWKHV